MSFSPRNKQTLTLKIKKYNPLMFVGVLLTCFCIKGKMKGIETVLTVRLSDKMNLIMKHRSRLFPGDFHTLQEVIITYSISICIIRFVIGFQNIASVFYITGTMKIRYFMSVCALVCQFCKVGGSEVQCTERNERAVLCKILQILSF